jgi:hypothetical protein
MPQKRDSDASRSAGYAAHCRAGHIGKQEERLVNESSIRSASQLEKTARKRADVAIRHETEAKAIRIKMARRRTLRFSELADAPIAVIKKSKPDIIKSSSLSNWQEQQQKDGRRI